MTTHLPGVYIVSDSIGETAEFVVRAAASQFNSGQMEIRRVPNIHDVEIIREVIQQARQNGFIIAYTIVLDELAEFMREEAAADAGLFEDPAEKDLYQSYQDIEARLQPLLEARDYEACMAALAAIRKDADVFFDAVMVMADDERIKANRLGLLKGIAQMFRKVAEFSLVLAG